MNKTLKFIAIVFAVLGLAALGVFFLVYSFLTSLAPPTITINEKYISINTDFADGISIEKIRVDSMGSEHYPVKYTVTYVTSCFFTPPNIKPPKKLHFAQKGEYAWTEEQVNVPFIHEGLSRKIIDAPDRSMSSNGTQHFEVCPLQWEKQQWYFVVIDDDRITGIFFYIDSSGQSRQYVLQSGVTAI